MSGAAGEPGGTQRKPPSAMRLLPWLLLPLILIPLVLAIIKTRRATPAPDTPAPVVPQDSAAAYPADTVPVQHPAHRTRPAAHPDSVAKAGGRPMTVTPDGQGAMGGDGPTGQGRPGGADTAQPIGPAPAGAMGGDGPPGRR